jgi:hypothetical protein
MVRRQVAFMLKPEVMSMTAWLVPKRAIARWQESRVISEFILEVQEQHNARQHPPRRQLNRHPN